MFSKLKLKQSKQFITGYNTSYGEGRNKRKYNKIMDGSMFASVKVIIF